MANESSVFEYNSGTEINEVERIDAHTCCSNAITSDLEDDFIPVERNFIPDHHDSRNASSTSSREL